ncbi:hypothetical protein C8R42DRAFT_650797 [Lentinula raphanica]|nr:hypothetical protein C8R42DRAFT_650797 [Lentinula raphanica]
MIKVLLLFALAWLTTSNIVKAVTTSDAIPFTEYRLLFGLCRDEGPDAHIAIRYKGYAYATLHYDECHPAEAEEEASLAEVGVFCRAAICFEVPDSLSDNESRNGNVGNSGLSRASQAFAFGPGDIVTRNGTDFPHILGGSAMCFQPSLSF